MWGVYAIWNDSSMVSFAGWKKSSSCQSVWGVFYTDSIHAISVPISIFFSFSFLKQTSCKLSRGLSVIYYLQGDFELVDLGPLLLLSDCHFIGYVIAWPLWHGRLSLGVGVSGDRVISSSLGFIKNSCLWRTDYSIQFWEKAGSLDRQLEFFYDLLIELNGSI